MGSILYISKRLYLFSGRALIINLVAMTLVGLLEGVGIILLIPMLQISNILNIGTEISNPTLQQWFSKLAELPTAYALILILGFYSALVIGQAVLQRNLALRNVKIHVHFINHLRMELYKRLLEANWLFYMKRKKSDFINALIDDLGRVSGGTSVFLHLLTSIVFTVVQLGIAFLLSPTITLFVLFAGAVLAYLTKTFLHAARKVGNQKSEIAKDYIGGLTEDFHGIKDIKSNSLESTRYEWLQNWCTRIENEQFLYSKIQYNSQVLYKVISTLLIAALIFITVIFFKNQPGQLIAIILIFSRLWPKFMGIQGNMQQIYSSISAFQSLLSLKEDSENASEGTDVCQQIDVAPMVINREIACQNVFFQYDPESPNALKNINLSIKVNEMTAFIGRSGAGKSTLIDILMGLLVPSVGHLTIDGKILTNDEILSLRKAISYVPQDPFLFNGTIRENLLLVKPDATENEMWEALEFAASQDFVSQLPNKLDTPIGDKGVMLSGGERQRLVLARAILRKPSLLILDEATSALDSENEGKIQASIERLKGKMTIIVIAHRLSTIRNADHIIVIDEGEIIQNGSFQSLASDEQKTFHSLLKKQMVLNV